MEQDAELLSELLTTFKELFEQAESYLDTMSCGESEIDDLNGLFRAIHSIKGNASILHLHAIVHYTHSIEEVVDAIRAEHLPITPLLVESLLLGLDRLKDLHYREIQGEKLENLHEKELEGLFNELAESKGPDIEILCHEVKSLLGAGFVNEDEQVDIDSLNDEAYSPPIEESTKQIQDLDFFKELAIQVDKQSEFWRDRSATLLGWALRMNEWADHPIDQSQLSAAVYLHDIGMSYVSFNTLNKSRSLTKEERLEIQQHPLWGYKHLTRISGWEVAARIILEHHEHVDGTGYPDGKKGSSLHEGAKILAIIDAYFSMTHGRADRANRRSIVRAICEINARKNAQFDEYWVNIFNDVIKEELKGKAEEQ